MVPQDPDARVLRIIEEHCQTGGTRFQILSGKPGRICQRFIKTYANVPRLTQ